MFEDALYVYSHVNVTGVDISREFDSFALRVVFTIENIKKTKIVKDIQYIHNEDIKHYRLENITYRANKIANLIDKVPDHIPNEQLVRLVDLRMEKL